VIRANYLGAPQAFDLNQACRVLVDAYGCNVYLVGSSLLRRDYRDVDVRCILSDDAYERLFPGIGETPQRDARWSIMCSAISLWLSRHSGLPIDFQFQQQTAANAEYEGARHSIGVFLEPSRRGE